MKNENRFEQIHIKKVISAVEMEARPYNVRDSHSTHPWKVCQESLAKTATLGI